MFQFYKVTLIVALKWNRWMARHIFTSALKYRETYDTPVCVLCFVVCVGAVWWSWLRPHSGEHRSQNGTEGHQ